MAKPCPSEFNVEVEILQPTEFPNGSGGQRVDFSSYFFSWAKLTLGTRSLQFREDVLKGVKFYTLMMRYDDRIKDTMAMKIDGELWSIQTADDIDGGKEFMQVVIRKGLGA